MIKFEKKNYLYKIYTFLPIIVLFISVLNEFDFDYLLVFIAGLINDTVVGLPLGLSSFSYILVCTFASYLRNITIRPHLIKDWFYFLFVISFINSINYIVLLIFFSYELDIMYYVINNLFTFLFYVPLSFLLNYYLKAIND